LQKEAEPRNHAHRECWNVLKCPYAWNKAHVATSTLTPNPCKQNRCNHVGGFAWERHRVALWRVEYYPVIRPAQGRSLTSGDEVKHGFNFLSKIILSCQSDRLILGLEGLLEEADLIGGTTEGGNAFISANLAEHDSKLKCHWTKRGTISIPKRQVAGFACHQNATLGIYITRDILANIETIRTIATDKQIVVFAEVFGVPVGDLFPPKQKSSGRIVGLTR
jgi:hypothetical protein